MRTGLPRGAKIIRVTSIVCIDKTGKRRSISARKDKELKELFKNLTEILKKAEKEGNLWKEQ